MTVLTQKQSAQGELIGFTTYDDILDVKTTKAQGTTSFMVCETATPPRGYYVSVGEPKSETRFVARILDGPFYTQKPGAYYLLELTSMITKGLRGAVTTRPMPGTPVILLDPKDVQSYVGTTGDFVLGRLGGQEDVEVAIDSTSLNRHIGVFGTTGAGKSNSVQVITEEASKSNWSILIFDIEGEYVAMNEPSDVLVDLLAKFGKKPSGVKDFHVFVPAPNTSRNIDAKKFGVPFADMDLEIFSEVLGLSPFERVYLFDIARKTKEISGNLQAYDINAVLNVLKKRIDAQVDRASLPEVVAEAHMGLYTKLSLAQRSGVLDAHQAGEVFDRIPPESFCQPGRISVIDVNESSDIVRNICIAHILKEIFRYKTRFTGSAPILIVVEEIHTFLSKAKRRMMTATLTMFTEMARQGRKRGIGLGLVSQQPALVPSELVELCNTRFMHRISSEPNIETLRRSTGNVPDSLWSLLPSLGNGQVLISSPKFFHAVVGQIRPNMSRRLRVEYG